MSKPPVPTALYRLFGDEDVLLYIGIAEIFGRRWHQHAQSQPWWGEVRRQAIDWHATREEAEAAETAAIKAEKPKYNIIHAEPPRRRRSAKPVPAAEPSVRTGRQWRPGRPVVLDLPLGEFLITAEDIRRCDPALPGSEEAAMGVYLDLWRRRACLARAIGQTLADLTWADENLSEDVKSRLSSTPAEMRARLLNVFYGTCRCCGGEPDAGMNCRECGAIGPEFGAAEQSAAA
jgi:hypothetical protein